MDEEKQRNNVLIIIILLLLIVIVGLAGFIVYDKVIKKENNNNTLEISEKENKVEEKDCPECKCESNLKNVVGVYESEPFDAGGEMLTESVELHDDNTFTYHFCQGGGSYGIYKVQEDKITFYSLIVYKTDPSLVPIYMTQTSEIGINGSFNYDERIFNKTNKNFMTVSFIKNMKNIGISRNDIPDSIDFSN